jgi:hypothetical protein
MQGLGSFQARDSIHAKDPRDQMNYDYRAFAWGAKAAQDGLVIADHPYLSLPLRAAWDSGFRFERHQSDRVDRCRAKQASSK